MYSTNILIMEDNVHCTPQNKVTRNEDSSLKSSSYGGDPRFASLKSLSQEKKALSQITAPFTSQWVQEVKVVGDSCVRKISEVV